MTIRIETALEKSGRYSEHNDVFLKPGFRTALAKEYCLEAVDIGFDNSDSFTQTIWLPAYKKKAISGGNLIIGAGFDKTGATRGLKSSDFARHMELLTSELHDQHINQLEVRTKHPIVCQPDHSDKVELSIELEISCAERLKQFSKSTRRNLRLPFKHGFNYIFDTQEQQLDDFYQLYLLSMHELGSLPHSKNFFRELWQNCRNDIGIFVGYIDNRPVAASFHFLGTNEIYGAWGCAHPDYKKYSVFIAMLWLILEYCEDSGRKIYNLGRTSVGSNAYHFKKRLANREHKIYHYVLAPSSPASQRSTAHHAAAWLIRHSPPQVMHTLSRALLHRFY